MTSRSFFLVYEISRFKRVDRFQLENKDDVKRQDGN